MAKVDLLRTSSSKRVEWATLSWWTLNKIELGLALACILLFFVLISLTALYCPSLWGKRHTAALGHRYWAFMREICFFRSIFDAIYLLKVNNRCWCRERLRLNRFLHWTLISVWLLDIFDHHRSERTVILTVNLSSLHRLLEWCALLSVSFTRAWYHLLHHLKRFVLLQGWAIYLMNSLDRLGHRLVLWYRCVDRADITSFHHLRIRHFLLIREARSGLRLIAIHSRLLILGIDKAARLLWNRSGSSHATGGRREWEPLCWSVAWGQLQGLVQIDITLRRCESLLRSWLLKCPLCKFPSREILVVLNVRLLFLSPLLIFHLLLLNFFRIFLLLSLFSFLNREVCQSHRHWGSLALTLVLIASFIISVAGLCSARHSLLLESAHGCSLPFAEGSLLLLRHQLLARVHRLSGIDDLFLSERLPIRFFGSLLLLLFEINGPCMDPFLPRVALLDSRHWLRCNKACIELAFLHLLSLSGDGWLGGNHAHTSLAAINSLGTIHCPISHQTGFRFLIVELLCFGIPCWNVRGLSHISQLNV